MDFDAVVAAVERHLTLYVAEFARKRVFVHAGVVGWKDRAVLIPGQTMTGKSTLVAALVQAGATYYSDEFAVIDSAGRIHPYPKPLQLRQEDGPTQSISLPVIGTKPLKVGLILSTRHRGGASFRLREMSAGEAMLALLTNTVSAHRNPGQALRTLRKVLAGAKSLKGSRGEADPTVGELLRRNLMPVVPNHRAPLAQTVRLTGIQNR